MKLSMDKEACVALYVSRMLDFTLYTLCLLSCSNHIMQVIVLGIILFSLTHISEYLGSKTNEKKMD